jgi:hypothetical protein
MNCLFFVLCVRRWDGFIRDSKRGRIPVHAKNRPLHIAQELVSHVLKSVTIDWTLRESARTQIRVLVRQILRKYCHPPDKQEKAPQPVLEQAKLLRVDWAN